MSSGFNLTTLREAIKEGKKYIANVHHKVVSTQKERALYPTSDFYEHYKNVVELRSRINHTILDIESLFGQLEAFYKDSASLTENVRSYYAYVSSFFPKLSKAPRGNSFPYEGNEPSTQFSKLLYDLNRNSVNPYVAYISSELLSKIEDQHYGLEVLLSKYVGYMGTPVRGNKGGRKTSAKPNKSQNNKKPARGKAKENPKSKNTK